MLINRECADCRASFSYDRRPNSRGLSRMYCDTCRGRRTQESQDRFYTKLRGPDPSAMSLAAGLLERALPDVGDAHRLHQISAQDGTITIIQMRPDTTAYAILAKGMSEAEAEAFISGFDLALRQLGAIR